MGTPDYIAPEQARDSHTADIRADLYSLGCTFYFLLTGQVPFPGGSLTDKLLRHQMEPPPSVRTRRPEVPEPLARVIDRLLAKRPADRYQTPTELIAALDLVASGKSAVPSISGSSERTLTLVANPFADLAVRGEETVNVRSSDTEGAAGGTSRWIKGYALVGASGVMLLGVVVIVLLMLGRKQTPAPNTSKPAVADRTEKQRSDQDASSADPKNVVPEKVQVLFDGKDLSDWVTRGGQPAAWKVENGYMEVGGGNIQTRDTFGPDFRLHLEFWLPLMENARSQGRANSGVFLQGRHEVQILDSYNNDTYANGSVGSLYGILAPDQAAQRKAIKPPEQWNTYDITFHAPRVDASNKLTQPGRLTVVLNGVPLITNGAFDRVSGGAINNKLGEPGPLLLQDHGCKVRFRNIWIQPLSNAFDATDLSGWEGQMKYWSIKDGALVGYASEDPRQNTCLCSKKKYGDFELRFQVRLKNGMGNSGVQIRSKLEDAEKFIVAGPQCDMGQGYWGSLYGERFGGMMKQSPPDLVKKVVRPNDFNDYSIKCVGKHVAIKINGETMVEGDFPKMPDEGIIAWQLHAGFPSMEVTFKDIHFTDLSKEAKK